MTTPTGPEDPHPSVDASGRGGPHPSSHAPDPDHPYPSKGTSAIHDPSAQHVASRVTASGESLRPLATIGLFAQLKVRLVVGGLRGNVRQLVGFVFALAGAVALAGFGFFVMAVLRLVPADVALSTTTLLFASLTFAWMFMPLLAFGLDDTPDPAKLALFPLRTREIALGLFTSSVTGVWPAVTLVVTSGAIVGLTPGPVGVLVGVPAVLLQFALCVVASRLITTVLSRALRSRRGRDVLAVSTIVAVLLVPLSNLLLDRGVGDPMAVLHGTAAALRWTPPGMAAHAIADGGLAGLAEVAVLAVLAVLGCLLWIKVLGRALVTPDVSTKVASVRRERGLVDRFLPDGPLAAVVTKELKYVRRDPRFRVNWGSSLFVAVVVGFTTVNVDTGRVSEWQLVLVTLITGLMIGLMSANAFGIDGRSLWMNAVVFATERDLRTDLAGRHLTTALIGAPTLAVVAVAAGVAAGQPATIVPALLAGWGLLGVGLGVGSMLSVLLPYTIPDRLNAFTGAAPGHGGLAFAGAFAGAVSIVALSLPFVIPTLLGVVWVQVAAPFYGLLVALLGRRLAARIGHARMPEMMQAVSKPT
ncbi:ABC-2 type transport system permease protein [Nonomuraea maritima]|uniref:ABC-2 type transport system permease protein n=1 Tax=Nonomuraea maritima TaxID=683260 RepID=A0A1G9AC45_9ACTN|nr:hypothetical protein [Nonomuraea maritima]SDK24811.1 ABC-2 type transport system permease protein [Nonomuraea maritima]